MTLMFSNVRYENEILGIEANERKINMSEKNIMVQVALVWENRTRKK